MIDSRNISVHEKLSQAIEKKYNNNNSNLLSLETEST